MESCYAGFWNKCSSGGVACVNRAREEESGSTDAVVAHVRAGDHNLPLKTRDATDSCATAAGTSSDGDARHKLGFGTVVATSVPTPVIAALLKNTSRNV